jgi:hypothetical protein
MQLKYYLTEADLLAHFEYEQSQSVEVQQRLFKGKVLRLVLILAIGGALLYFGYKIPALFLFTYAIFHWFFAERVFAPRRKAIFLDMLRKQNDAFLTTEIGLNLDKEYVYQLGGKSTKTPFRETSSLVQLKESHLFVQLKSGQGMIIPLHALKNANEVIARCRTIADAHGFPFVQA